MRPARRRLVFLSAAIAALAAVLALVLPAVSASAATSPAAGTRVGASHPGMILTVGSSRLVSPGKSRDRALPQAQIVAGACVAAEDTGAGSTAERLAATCGGASFTAGTKVLLGSGVAVPIASLKPGDKVLATNIRTGKTKAEPVTAVLVHHDTDRYDLTVRTSHGTAVIETTSSHLFFDQTTGRWTTAAALSYGDKLRTSEGTTATAAGGYVPAIASGWMWDLSVPGGGDHDFYIDTAATAVLVHNCDVPGLDATGKIHTNGDLPSYIPDNWTAEQIQQLESDLQQSIQTRQQAMQDLGEEPAHMQRLQQEFQLLRQIQKWLSGS